MNCYGKDSGRIIFQIIFINGLFKENLEQCLRQLFDWCTGAVGNIIWLGFIKAKEALFANERAEAAAKLESIIGEMELAGFYAESDAPLE